MNSEAQLTKALCTVFKLTEVLWMPASVKALLFYLLENPSLSIAGNLLYIDIKKQKIIIQLLTIIIDRGEIIAEKQEIFPCSDVFNFQEKLIAYAAELGVYSKGLWEIDHILLFAEDEKDVFAAKVIREFQNTIPISVSFNKPQAIWEELNGRRYSGPIFQSIMVVYPRHFYIEKKTAQPKTQVEFIPFATDLLALDITQRYKIFSFRAGSEYNLAEKSNQLKVKIFEKPFSHPSPAEENALELVLEETREIEKDQVINIYLNLPQKRLEINCSQLSVYDKMLNELQTRQQSGYDLIKDSQLLNAQLLSDFGLHLQHQNIPGSSEYTINTVYFRALCLLSLLTGKK